MYLNFRGSKIWGRGEVCLTIKKKYIYIFYPGQCSLYYSPIPSMCPLSIIVHPLFLSTKGSKLVLISKQVDNVVHECHLLLHMMFRNHH